MKDSVVRIHKIEINNIKNTEAGTLVFAAVFDEKCPTLSPEILGVYGQNGTGKTAVVDTLTIIQHLLAGRTLPETTHHILLKDSSKSTIKVTFFIIHKGECIKVEYQVVLRVIGQPVKQLSLSPPWEEEQHHLVHIAEERVRYARWREGGFERKSPFIHVRSSSPQTFFPKQTYSDFVAIKQNNAVDFAVASGIAQRTLASRIFSKDCYQLFFDFFKKEKDGLPYILSSLRHYAQMNFFIIANQDFGFINSNVFMPMSFFIADGNASIRGQTPMSLQGPYTISRQEYHVQKRIIAQVKIALSAIIPQLELELIEHNQELLPHGEKGVRVELISKRNGLTIPLQYESAGIIKILSLLSAFIHVYNNASACLVVDELDAGIFEYLLGEILQLFAESGKGQILFTSHNLRPLEVLDKSQVIFSTTNSKQRYLKLKNIKQNNNLRDKYLRHIVVGGQAEDLYLKTNRVAIARAFREAVKGL